MGGTVTAMSAMIAGFVTNIVLDYLFVWVFPWGMTGAAVATVIGQAATFGVCLGYLIVKKQKPDFRFGGKCFHFAGKTLVLGLSPFGLAFSPNFMLIFVNFSASAVGGQFALNCFAPVSYAISVVLLLLQGVSDGCQPLVSREFGRDNARGARRVRNMAYVFALAVAAVCIAVMFIVRGGISKVFGAMMRSPRKWGTFCLCSSQDFYSSPFRVSLPHIFMRRATPGAHISSSTESRSACFCCSCYCRTLWA